MSPSKSTRHNPAPLGDAEIEHGARAIEIVVDASVKLQRLRNRIAALETAIRRVRSHPPELAA